MHGLQYRKYFMVMSGFMHGLQYRMYFMVMSGLHAWFIV